MARIDNLKNFLTDIANAIKEKTGKTDVITPANFDTEIASIQTGGSSTPAKGLVINEYDEDGYAKSVSIVGIDDIPEEYCRDLFSIPLNATGASGNLFYRVTDFSSVLPENVTSIGTRAFSGCTNLNLTKLPDGITNISNHAFYSCTNLALTSLPSKYNQNIIEDYAFYNCTNLALTSLPDGIIDIRQNAFYSCKKLALIKLPDGLISIGNYAFSNCYELSLIKLPDGLTSIGRSAFDVCKNLAITEIPSGITRIEDSTFRFCTKLEHITFLGQITSISSNAFSNCENLIYISLPNVISVPSLSSSTFNNTPIKNGTGYIYVPDNLVESFKTASYWSAFANQIKPISELE